MLDVGILANACVVRFGWIGFFFSFFSLSLFLFLLQNKEWNTLLPLMQTIHALLPMKTVAVKVLSETRGNGEEFINEIASTSRTSHVNLVSLLGNCFHGSKRALIYEFMPYVSLDKFIYERNSSRTIEGLGWKTLYNIAIGVARGVQYLHRGCNAPILHLDIKLHNILLDENVCPKKSDFGLSKLCLRKESIISLSGARGTAGYIAPEIFSRSFENVSHKSDIYCYGMMVLEMAGGRKIIDAEADHTSEIYIPHCIYKRLELDVELGLQGLRNEDERTRAKWACGLYRPVPQIGHQ